MGESGDNPREVMFAEEKRRELERLGIHQTPTGRTWKDACPGCGEFRVCIPECPLRPQEKTP